MTLRTGGKQFDGHPKLLFDKVHINQGFFGKLLLVGNAADIALPAGQHGINRSGVLKQPGHREIFHDPAVDLVAGTYFDLIKINYLFL